MSATICYNIISKERTFFLTEYFLLALDKRHIIVDYYHVQTTTCCLPKGIRRKCADT